ncbi:MAG: CP12 domain-containing protein, partial [Elainellaceae cyanobacterium]
TPLKTSTLETMFQAALEHARRLTTMHGTSNIDVAIAWGTVEELQTAKAAKQFPAESALDCYCAAHPDAPECRIYEC